MSKAKRRALYAEKLRKALHERWAREQQASRQTRSPKGFQSLSVTKDLAKFE